MPILVGGIRSHQVCIESRDLAISKTNTTAKPNESSARGLVAWLAGGVCCSCVTPKADPVGEASDWSGCCRRKSKRFLGDIYWLQAKAHYSVVSKLQLGMRGLRSALPSRPIDYQ